MRLKGSPGFATGAVRRCHFVAEGFLNMRDSNALGLTASTIADCATVVIGIFRRRLPLSPGRAERHGFEYYRHGTLSLYAALNQTDEVIGQTAPRHNSEEFVAFLGEVIASQPADQEIHIILDNLSAHKTPLVKLHFTPTYSSWLNQVEIWFSRLEREVIARGIFCFRPAAQDYALHSALRQSPQAIPLEIL